jgi:transcriptional regulator with XRE-family HTH domain
MYAELIGDELRSIRNRYKYSLKNIEEITGIHAQTLCEYENGKVKITVFTLERILKAYNMDLYIFFKIIYENTHNLKLNENLQEKRE